MSLKIFICYAHEDEQFLNKLKSHLRPLQEEGLIFYYCIGGSWYWLISFACVKKALSLVGASKFLKPVYLQSLVHGTVPNFAHVL